MQLHIFNPENDLALADGGANYCAPPAARQIAFDLGALPLWFAPCADVVHLPGEIQKEYYASVSSLFNIAEPYESLHCGSLTGVSPWGWSPQIVRRLKQLGIPSALLPSDECIGTMRALSNRRSSIKILSALNEAGIDTPSLPRYFTTIDAAAAYIGSKERCVVKAPWSGSGKGIMWGLGRMEVPMEHFCKGVIRRQGGVVCEEFLFSKKEFAMEFRIVGGKAHFVGYSLFDAFKGAYTGNLLAADEEIESLLTEYIAVEKIAAVRRALPVILEQLLAGSGYEGYLGIDMMLYDDGGKTRLNPCIELNLRMNMGVVSRLFYNRFVSPGATGRFFVAHYGSDGAAYAEHCRNRELYPLRVSSSRIESGYLNLSPITPENRYAVYVIIGKADY